MIDSQISEYLTNQKSKNLPAFFNIPVDKGRMNEQIMVEELQAGVIIPEELTILDNFIPANHGKENTSHETISASTSDVHSIPIRQYIPNNKANDSLIIYYHGGGWVFGSIQISDLWCRTLAVKTGITVVSVEYRCAPEFPFPIPVDDCYSVFSWIASNTSDFGTAPGKIALCGDSAGGNLAASVCLKAKKLSGPKICAQLLIYPVIDLSSMETQSYIDYSDGYLLTKEGMQWFREKYLANSQDAFNPLASPILAEDLSGLPSSVIITAEFDPLSNEGASYAERLKSAGVSVTYICYPGLIHAFMYMGNISAAAASAVDDMFEKFRSLILK